MAKGHEPSENAIFFLRPFFSWFHRYFCPRQRSVPEEWLAMLFPKNLRYLFVFVLIVTAMGFLFHRMPTAYLPDEDQGMLMCSGNASGKFRSETHQRGPG